MLRSLLSPLKSPRLSLFALILVAGSGASAFVVVGTFVGGLLDGEEVTLEATLSGTGATTTLDAVALTFDGTAVGFEGIAIHSTSDPGASIFARNAAFDEAGNLTSWDVQFSKLNAFFENIAFSTFEPALFAGGTATWTVEDGFGNLSSATFSLPGGETTPIPEPGAVALGLGMGAMFLVGWRRRQTLKRGLSGAV